MSENSLPAGSARTGPTGNAVLDRALGLVPPAAAIAWGSLLLWSRLVNLQTSFWNDEAYTAQVYVKGGPHAIFLGTYVPNNHVLFSLLDWATTRILGDFEAAYRIWSVFPAIGAIVLATWWVRKRFGTVEAVVVAVLATVSPVHLVLAPQARGYGLGMLAGVGMLCAAIRAGDHGRKRDILLFAGFGLIGIWTLPIFAIAFVAQGVTLAVARPDARRRTVIAIAVVGLASLAFYAPMLGDLVHNTDQQFGQRLPWTGWATGPYLDLARPTIAATIPLHTPDRSAGALALVAIVALVAFACVKLWRRDTPVLAHLVVPPLVTFAVLVAGRFYVESRFTSFLLFHFIVLVAVGAGALSTFVGRSAAARAAAVAIAVALALTGAGRTVTATRAEARLPYENVKMVREIVDATHIQRVITNTVHPVNLQYYVGANHLQVMPTRSVALHLYCAVRTRFIFVDDQYHKPGPIDSACLRQRNATLLQVPQQTNPPIRNPGAIAIWVVPALPPR